MRTRTKVTLTSVIALMLCIVCSFVFCASSFNKQGTVLAVERHIVLTNELDTDSILNEYEDASFDIDGMLATFDGYQAMDPNVLSNIDNISEQEMESLSSCRVHYTYTYNAETNIVTISAEMVNEFGEIQIDQLSGIAFTNEAGEIDAVLSLDGEDNVLLSDLLKSNSIDNVGWLSRLFKKVVVVVAVAVTVAVAAAITVVTAGTGAVATVAAATAAISAVAYSTGNEIYEKTQAYINYQHNQKLDYTVTGPVNGQKYYSQWKFGVRTFDYNGCGVIATYNVMYLMGKKEKLSKVAYDIERKSGTLAWGFAGTDPTHPYEYFREKGISIKQYYSQSAYEKALKNMKTSQYALLCFWNNKDTVLEGAHFVAVQKDKSGKYEVYNKYSSGKVTYPAYSFGDIIDNGKLITGFIVN